MILTIGGRLRSLDQLNNRDNVHGPWWSGPLIFVLIILAIFLYATSSWWLSYFRKSSKFSKRPLDRSQLMDAYVCIATAMSQGDKEQEYRFMEQYFQEHFSDVYKPFREFYQKQLEQPIVFDSVIKWLNKHLDDSGKREILQFAFDMMLVDDSINSYEHESLIMLSKKLAIRLDSLEPRTFKSGRV